MKQLSLFNSPDSDRTSADAATIWKVYIDGAARNNPGPAGAGIVIIKSGKIVEKHGFYLGSRTNNQAEYFALLLGVFLVKSRIADQDLVTIISDSQLLVRQFKGEYKVKHPELKPLHLLAQTLLQGMRYTIEHVFREDNAQADYMANHGIDKKVVLSEQFKQFLAQHGIS